MKEEKILLTPALAKEILENNYEGNRRIRESVVEKYATAIKEGRWNPEVSRVQDPMLFSKSGHLLNGQHRCFAVIDAGVPVYIYVKRDVDEDIYKYLDDGEKRGARDFIKIPNASAVATLAKRMYAIENGSAPLATALTGKISSGRNCGSILRQQILDKVNEDPEKILEYVRLGMKGATYFGNKKDCFAVALFIIDFCGRGDVINRFVDECSAMIPDAQPILAFRSYIAKCFGQPLFKSDYKWMCGCIFYAYEAFRIGDEINMFNKYNVYFSRYDKYVADKRKENRNED